ncbi:hypothetical protein [Clostridium perfringens]|uniref:hypothetical protein n=1 Tax=Clostridium perfringens TaxID=1502 RepID=UPI000DF0EF9B|nr:hypothetical protein [Clostridium perfringens]MBI6054470.1 hypothetical protein [Clostridium perfringens]MDH2459441.1 hypothetical protein [Clostridium perfringens]MDM0822061.1 hypothetical protein [Clostridium perfringens]STB59767.1 Uncharacterised protein [Clostridium perfringens]
MYFNSKTQEFDNGVEIMATYRNRVTFSCTVSDSGVAEKGGKKIVPKGSLLDKSGVVKNDATVVGILAEEVDVTNGPKPGALIVEGYVLKDRLPVAPQELAIGALKKITFK